MKNGMTACVYENRKTQTLKPANSTLEKIRIYKIVKVIYFQWKFNQPNHFAF